MVFWNSTVADDRAYPVVRLFTRDCPSGVNNPLYHCGHSVRDNSASARPWSTWIIIR